MWNSVPFDFKASTRAKYFFHWDSVEFLFDLDRWSLMCTLLLTISDCRVCRCRMFFNITNKNWWALWYLLDFLTDQRISHFHIFSKPLEPVYDRSGIIQPEGGSVSSRARRSPVIWDFRRWIFLLLSGLSHSSRWSNSFSRTFTHFRTFGNDLGWIKNEKNEKKKKNTVIKHKNEEL